MTECDANTSYFVIASLLALTSAVGRPRNEPEMKL